MNRKLIAAAFALASLASTPAFSQAYVSAGAGVSHASLDCTGTDTCDNDDMAFRLIGGYQFDNNVSAEAMYFSLGKTQATLDIYKESIETSFWGLGAAYRADFGQGWYGTVRGGAAFANSRLEVSATGMGSGSQSRDSVHAYFGLGGSYAITKNVRLDADWLITKMSFAAGDFKYTNPVHAFTLGATYGF